MKFGMISCNFYSRIYDDYMVPSDMSWPQMVQKHYDEFKDLPGLLRLIKAYGVDFLELWEPHAPYRAMDRAGAAGVRKACEDSGLTPLVYCVGGWNNSHIDVMERGFEFAAGLGAGVINGTIPCHGNEAALDRIDELAQKYKIRFSIENHAHPALESPEEIIAVLESHSAYIGANLDVGIYYRTGYDVLAAAKLFGPRIYHVHFKDVKGRNAAGSCASGTGEAPLKELADYLKSVGYAGMISLEHEPRYDPRPDLDAGVPYCKKILGIA